METTERLIWESRHAADTFDSIIEEDLNAGECAMYDGSDDEWCGCSLRPKIGCLKAKALALRERAATVEYVSPYAVAVAVADGAIGAVREGWE